MKLKNDSHNSSFGGWGADFRSAFSNLRSHALYSWINIVGLAVSLAACILIMLWVWDEVSFDKFHRNADNIYRMNAKIGEAYWPVTPAPVAVNAKGEMPGIENFCRMKDYQKGFWEYDNHKFYANTFSGAAVDPSFFVMFDFPLIKGTRGNPFTDDLSMIISETKAKIIFGDKDPIGETLKASDDMTFHIVGIMRDMPENSSLQYDYIVPFAVQQRTFEGNGDWKFIEDDWGNYHYQAYLQLAPGVNAAATGEKISAMVNRIRSDNSFSYQFALEPLLKQHLYRPDGQPAGIKTVRLMGIIAVLILVIACINYVNLVTARAAKRNKEISMKKIMGAGRLRLIAQLTGETLLLFLIALALSTILIYLLFPAYNQMAGKEMVFSLFNPSVLAIYGITALSVIVLAGLYPALYLSSFKPLDAFRTKAPGSSKNGYLRKTLVVLQFVFSFGLIVATIIISEQMNYMRKKDLGYDKEYTFTFRSRSIGAHYEMAKNELMKNTDILGVSAANDDNMEVGGSRGGTGWEGKEAGKTISIFCAWTQYDFLKLMDIKLESGEYPAVTDSTGIWLNETAVKTMGMDDPIGKQFYLNDGDYENARTIKGIVKDYNFESLNEPVRPLLLVPVSWAAYNYIYVKTTAAGAKSAIASVENLWKQYNSNYEFSYHFLDDNFDKMYRSDLRTEKLLYIFAIIAIFVSCLGLFGLVTFTAETKTKEIGIRKVLGAKIGTIVQMLSKEFLILVGISMVVAFPLAYYFLNKMLQDYAYRIHISWWMFALAAVITLALTMLTVGWKAVKAATANPAKSIKTE